MVKSKLWIDEFDVRVPDRFSRLNGVRILHISDLHLVAAHREFDEHFQRLSQIECDLVAVSGDLIDTEKGADVCAAYLSRLRPKIGTFVTYGNHDRYRLGLWELIFFRHISAFRQIDLGPFEAALAARRINVLDNAAISLSINGKKVNLIGLDCPLGYDRLGGGPRFRARADALRPLVEGAGEDAFNILITHVPDFIQEFDTQRIALILAGHTHGGQIRIPFLGPLLAMSRFQRQYNMGLFKYNDSWLHVSPGLGMSRTTPVRFRCPGRAAVITLKADKI